VEEPKCTDPSFDVLLIEVLFVEAWEQVIEASRPSYKTWFVLSVRFFHLTGLI
jgi:hypothetical protein